MEMRPKMREQPLGPNIVPTTPPDSRRQIKSQFRRSPCDFPQPGGFGHVLLPIIKYRWGRPEWKWWGAADILYCDWHFPSDYLEQ